MAEYNMPQYILREFKVTDARVRTLIYYDVYSSSKKKKISWYHYITFRAHYILLTWKWSHFDRYKYIVMELEESICYVKGITILAREHLFSW